MIVPQGRTRWLAVAGSANAAARSPIVTESRAMRRTAQTLAWKRGPYSHSIVPGGFDVMSRTTRLTSRISLIMREAICSSRS